MLTRPRMNVTSTLLVWFGIRASLFHAVLSASALIPGDKPALRGQRVPFSEEAANLYRRFDGWLGPRCQTEDLISPDTCVLWTGGRCAWKVAPGRSTLGPPGQTRDGGSERLIKSLATVLQRWLARLQEVFLAQRSKIHLHSAFFIYWKHL